MGFSGEFYELFLLLTLYILTSVCIFSTLFSKHFLWCRQGEVV